MGTRGGYNVHCTGYNQLYPNLPTLKECQLGETHNNSNHSIDREGGKRGEKHWREDPSLGVYGITEI